jgi:hypothetical protein
MKRLLASAAIAVPLILGAFVTQANAGVTIRLGNPQDDYYRNDRDYRQNRDWQDRNRQDRDYRRNERRNEYRYNLRRNSIFTTPNRNIRAIEQGREGRVWIPDHWGTNSRGRVWIPGYYIYQ